MVPDAASRLVAEFSETDFASQEEFIAGAYGCVETFLGLLGFDFSTATEEVLGGLLVGLLVQSKTLERAAPQNFIEATLTYAEIAVIYWTMQSKGWA